MRLSEILREKAVVLGIRDLSKWELIETMTDVLVESGQISGEHRDLIHQSLIEREKSMSTGMENGVAIPHCCVNLINETVVSLAISREGIDFDSIDSGPSHLIILLVTPKNKTKMHIKTLAEIAKLLNNTGSRQNILNASTPGEVLDVIRKEEKGQIVI